MSKAGDVFENPVTGERAVVRIGTEQTGGELLVVDLYIRPGGAVMGEHLHPAIEERFTALRGRVGFRPGWDHISLPKLTSVVRISSKKVMSRAASYRLDRMLPLAGCRFSSPKANRRNRAKFSPP